MEMIKTFENQNNIKIPFTFAERRKGDVEKCYANPKLAQKKLGWKAEFGIDEMCKSAWESVKNESR